MKTSNALQLYLTEGDYLGRKSDLLVCLEGHAEPQSEAPTVTAVVFDRAVIVQMLKPGTAKTFEEYAQKVFIPYVVRQLQHVSRLDLVWNSYRADSLKASTREQRGKGVRRRVVGLGSHTRKLAKFPVS